jgi:hypothetical protein
VTTRDRVGRLGIWPYVTLHQFCAQNLRKFFACVCEFLSKKPKNMCENNKMGEGI